MTLNLSSISSPLRSLEMLAGSDALVGTPQAATGQLADLGPITSALDGSALDPAPTAPGGAAGTAADIPLAGAATQAANAGVLEVHANLEEASHNSPLTNYPVHDLTNLGETIGLGYIGQEKGGETNLLTDAAGLPQQLASGGGISSAIPIVADAGEVADAATVLATRLAHLADPGAGLVGPGGLANPFVEALNDTVQSVEHLGRGVPILDAPLHAVTEIADAVGLGHVGETGGTSNLLTDLVGAPGQVVAGNALGLVPTVLDDLGHGAAALPGLAGAGTGLLAPGGGILGSTGLAAPVTGLANAAVLETHAGIEQTGHDIPAPVLNEPLHALTSLGETVGLGYIGGGGPTGGTNLVTDLASAPGEVVGGQAGGAVSSILADTGPVATATDTLIGSLTHLADASTVGAVVDGLVAAGPIGAGGTSGVVDTVAHLADAGTGTGGTVGIVTGLVDGALSTVAAATGAAGGGSQPLISVAAGGPDAHPLAGADLLAPASEGPTHAADAHAGTAAPGQPSAISVAVLGGDAISVPSLGGAGADSLVGMLAATAPATATATHDVAPAIDLASLATVSIPGLDGHGLQAPDLHATATHGLAHGLV